MKMKKIDKILNDYKSKQDLWKIHIRLEENKFKRVLKWILYWIAFPFVWLFYNIRDIRTLLIFVIVCLAVSVEVWLPYLIGAICWNNETIRITMFSIGSACWLFWIGPGTPFMVICISITIAIKSLINKFRRKK